VSLFVLGAVESKGMLRRGAPQHDKKRERIGSLHFRERAGEPPVLRLMQVPPLRRCAPPVGMTAS